MISDAMSFGHDGGFRTETTTSKPSDSVSRKGIKADGALTITDGRFIMDTEDDSFHAGGNIIIAGDTFQVKSGDDAVHSDADVMIQDGDFNVSYCYEGFEGQTVAVDNGNFDITSFDDGFNSAGGADSSGFEGRGPKKDRFASSSNSSITINGGTIVIVSDGDCFDSNGTITINGGKLDLTCNGNGNTALDCDGDYTNNGGDVTTNDDSENNPGQMGGPGGMRGHGGMGDPGGRGGPGGMRGPDGMDRKNGAGDY